MGSAVLYLRTVVWCWGGGFWSTWSLTGGHTHKCYHMLLTQHLTGCHETHSSFNQNSSCGKATGDPEKLFDQGTSLKLFLHIWRHVGDMSLRLWVMWWLRSVGQSVGKFGHPRSRLSISVLCCPWTPEGPIAVTHTRAPSVKGTSWLSFPENLQAQRANIFFFFFCSEYLTRN